MKVLVCTDGSLISNKAVRMAVRIKETMADAEITVVHVQQPVYIPGPFGVGHVSNLVVPDYLEKQLEEEGQKILHNAEKEFTRIKSPAKTVLLKGQPAATITEYAAEQNFDLIVIGSRGRSGLEKLLLGSVSSAVVQLSRANTLVVK